MTRRAKEGDDGEYDVDDDESDAISSISIPCIPAKCCTRDSKDRFLSSEGELFVSSISLPAEQ